MSELKITFVRHGETENNFKKLYQGREDKLTELGREQAKKLALRLKDEKFDVIFCSTLKRTRETAEEILKFHKDTQVVYSEEIRERDIGELEGTPWSVEDDSPELYATHKPQGGESRLEFLDRIRKFIDFLHKNYREKEVLLITHGGVSRMLNNIVNNNLPEFQDVNWTQDNCCVNIVEFENEAPKFKLINCTKHLK